MFSKKIIKLFLILSSILISINFTYAKENTKTESAQSTKQTNIKNTKSTTETESQDTTSQSFEDKIKICATCHGETGQSISGIYPHLAAQNVEYLYKQLKDIKSKVREVPEMVNYLDNFNDEELKQLAKFYNQQNPALGAGDKKLIEEGATIYLFGDIEKNIPACSSCHGRYGLGNDKFPLLIGQNKTYLKQQIEKFRTKARKNDPNGMMQYIAMLVPEKELNAIIEFLHSARVTKVDLTPIKKEGTATLSTKGTSITDTNNIK